MSKRLVVIGGGAAGFFCAINAASLNPELTVTIVERSSKLLSKVRISGGGRCNVTHSCYSISAIIKRYPRGGAFLKKAFQHFFTTDTIKWFEAREVYLKIENDGRMFPVTDSSEAIINCLLTEAASLNIKILLNKDADGVHYARANDYAKEMNLKFHQEQIDSAGNAKLIPAEAKAFQITFSHEKTLEADYVCVACGGFPKIEHFDWIKKLGHSIVEPVPSLFTFKVPAHKINSLMGISVPDVIVRISETKYQQRGALLITHWGFSGPVILKLSAFAAIDLASLNYNYKIMVNWLPLYNETTVREHMYVLRTTLAQQKIINRNPFDLPQRLWEFLLMESDADLNTRWATLELKTQNLLAKNLCSHVFQVKGKTTFKEEFVTAGGVTLSEIDPNTMESKIMAGLFFAGEIMNVDGITGGYNFQHAWTSGWIAGNTINKKSQS